MRIGDNELELFLKKRNKKDSFIKKSSHFKNEVYINVKQGNHVLKQIDMINLSLNDLCIIRTLQPNVEQHLTEIVDHFYQNLEKESSLMKIIKNHSTIEKLKQTLRSHIHEMFSGQIDDAYIKQRYTIAHVHVKVGLEPKWYMCAFQELLHSLLTIAENQVNSLEEFKQVALAITKIVSLEQQIVLEAYELENERIRKEAEEVKTQIMVRVNQNATELAAVSEETSSAIHQLTEKSNQIKAVTQTGSEIAISTEEKSEEGIKRLKKLEAVMKETEQNMLNMSTDMEYLIDNTKKIEQIVVLVTSIAEQTNLLALNASIEAARSGEHGRGFAIVAEEVRKLAEGTKKSVSEVSQLISNMSNTTHQISSSIQEVSEGIKTGTIETQRTNEFFDHILHSMMEVKDQNIKINEEICDFNQIFEEINKAAEHVAITSDALTNMTTTL